MIQAFGRASISDIGLSPNALTPISAESAHHEGIKMSWTVREAVFEDADHLALVGGATFLETFAGVLDGDAIVDHCLREHSPAAYRRYLEAGGRAWLVETDPGKAPIGFLLLGAPNLPGSRADGTDIELKRIYTLSKFHGTGIGRELIARAVAHAEKHGFRRLLLGVYAGNSNAQNFYAKHGFTRIADRQFQVGERLYDDVVLAKSLDGGAASDGGGPANGG